jgi:hypothetical protein
MFGHTCLGMLICIPRASPGMMCVCRRRRLADKDLGQPASSRPIQLVLDRRLPKLIPITA